MKAIDKNILLQIAIAIAGPAIGVLLIFLLKKFLYFPKPVASVTGFFIAGIFIIVLIPRVYKMPFGKIPVSQFLVNLGLYIPKKWMEHLLLGVLVSAVMLTGLLSGSILTFKYSFDSSTINAGQILFSLTPGIWEEFCFRGMIMVILLNATRSMKKAFIWQIVIFGACHIKGFDLLSIIDAFSVIIIAIVFTYLTIKTRSLFAPIVAHFLYDSFLFVVQLPGGVYKGFADNAWLYSCLWLSVGFSLVIIKIFTEKLHFCGHLNFLQISGYSDESKKLINVSNVYDLQRENSETKELSTEEIEIEREKERKNHLKEEKSHKTLSLVNGAGFLAIFFIGLEEYSFLVKSGFLLGSLGNIMVYFFWNKVKSFALPAIYILDAILYCTKAFKLHEHGSPHAYMFFYIIGIGYLIAGVIVLLFRGRLRNGG